jgi:hypothetical protein
MKLNTPLSRCISLAIVALVLAACGASPKPSPTARPPTATVAVSPTPPPRPSPTRVASPTPVASRAPAASPTPVPCIAGQEDLDVYVVTETGKPSGFAAQVAVYADGRVIRAGRTIGGQVTLPSLACGSYNVAVVTADRFPAAGCLKQGVVIAGEAGLATRVKCVIPAEGQLKVNLLTKNLLAVAAGFDLNITSGADTVLDTPYTSEATLGVDREYTVTVKYPANEKVQDVLKVQNVKIAPDVVNPITMTLPYSGSLLNVVVRSDGKRLTEGPYAVVEVFDTAGKQVGYASPVSDAAAFALKTGADYEARVRYRDNPVQIRKVTLANGAPRGEVFEFPSKATK